MYPIFGNRFQPLRDICLLPLESLQKVFAASPGCDVETSGLYSSTWGKDFVRYIHFVRHIHMYPNFGVSFNLWDMFAPFRVPSESICPSHLADNAHNWRDGQTPTCFYDDPMFSWTCTHNFTQHPKKFEKCLSPKMARAAL